jgi:2-methylcitrate synthase
MVRHFSLILTRAQFNAAPSPAASSPALARTCIRRSPAASARCAGRARRRERVSDEIQKRYKSADEAEADIRKRMAAKEIVIGFGHPVYTTGDPRNKVIKAVAERLVGVRRRPMG